MENFDANKQNQKLLKFDANKHTYKIRIALEGFLNGQSLLDQ
jgi:hypothetical protein